MTKNDCQNIQIKTETYFFFFIYLLISYIQRCVTPLYICQNFISHIQYEYTFNNIIKVIQLRHRKIYYRNFYF